MTVCKCDRCGKEYEYNNGILSEFKPIRPDEDEVKGNFVTGITIRYKQLLKNDKIVTGCFRTIDLCDDCIKKLMQYLENKKDERL